MRVYLAAPIGMYQGAHTAAAAGGPSLVHRVLLSYLPQFKTVDPLLRALDRTMQPVDYCVDSGAHVWLGDFFKKEILPPVEQAEKFLQLFVASIKNLQHKPSFVVELDIQRLYGDDRIAAWRRDIWAPFEQETGIRVCYVWHPINEIAGWKRMLECEWMRFLAMASNHQISAEQRTTMVLQAYKVGKPVHGFAAINVTWLKATPFFSVDSTSWAVSAQAFGNAVVFDPTSGGLKRYKVGNAQARKDKSAAMLGLIKTGIHASDVIDLGRQHNRKNYGRYYTQSAEPYKQLEEWHTARWRGKGIDWEKRLAESGNVIAGSAGGHFKAPPL